MLSAYTRLASCHSSLTENCVTTNQSTEDSKRLSSQKKAERMRMIIFTGSDAIVNRKRDRAGPYAVRAHPKNERTVIVLARYKPSANYHQMLEKLYKNT